MLTPTRGSDAGKWLRAERERLRLSTREVERLSHEIAQSRQDRDYYISHAWLADIEAGKFKPNLFKLKSLSLIYKRNLDEILAFFGVNVREAGTEPGLVGLPRTHLLASLPPVSGETILAPVQLREKVKIEQTNLVSRMFESWGEVPVALLQQMGLRNSLFGYIGTEDYTLYPLIRPGSFVQIDSKQTKIRSNWQNEFDRPIYFVELRDGYVCCWCELQGSQLFLLPTAQSGAKTRQVRYPGDADIVGRVTAITMRIAEPTESLLPLRPPARS
jgi:transcriptional regulator with XRE-family HTH domain